MHKYVITHTYPHVHKHSHTQTYAPHARTHQTHIYIRTLTHTSHLSPLPPSVLMDLLAKWFFPWASFRNLIKQPSPSILRGRPPPSSPIPLASYSSLQYFTGTQTIWLIPLSCVIILIIIIFSIYSTCVETLRSPFQDDLEPSERWLYEYNNN